MYRVNVLAKGCGSCEYWGGERTRANCTPPSVETETPHVKGMCQNAKSPWSGKQMTASSSGCAGREYVKWRFL